MKRITKTRQLLLEVFEEVRTPLSVPELTLLLAQKKYYPHKTTLYREIEHMIAEGLLSKVQLSESRVSYEIRGEHHHHFVCQNCFGVTELTFCEPLMEKITTKLARQGKQVIHHTFEFFGVCESCL